MTVSLKSKQGTVYASTIIPQVGGKPWKKLSFQLLPKESAPDDDNVFSITVDGKAAAGQTIFFGMFSLFPPTFRGRENGMRIDLAEALAGTRPGVWRFPGGNNLKVCHHQRRPGSSYLCHSFTRVIALTLDGNGTTRLDRQSPGVFSILSRLTLGFQDRVAAG